MFKLQSSRGFARPPVLKHLLHLYWSFARGLTVGVRAAVFDANGGVLLVRHSYAPGWHLPGGGVEPGESLTDALARELEEEGNILLKGAPQLHGVFQNIGVSRRDHVAVFVVREFEWKGPKAAGMEIREAAFFPVKRLPEGATAGTTRRLGEILRGEAPSQTW
jgi:ADP-ribose pyrophosphatase YjhB (NUDIX family)